jgi:cytidylate kinase
MKHPVIITIARQFGSGGHEIGRRLAEYLGVPCYDKELLTHAAQESGLSEEVVAYFDEKPTSSLLYTLSTGAYALNESGLMNYSMPINQQVFQAQFDAIRSLSEKGACVIVGRCADYVLQNYPHLVTVYLYADLEHRVARVAEFDGISLQEAKTRVTRSDKKRANYYNFYSGKKWGTASHYDLCVNTTSIDYEKIVELIAQFAEMKFADAE